MNNRQKRTAGAGAGLASLLMVASSVPPCRCGRFRRPGVPSGGSAPISRWPTARPTAPGTGGRPPAPPQRNDIRAAGGGKRLVQYFDKSRMEINNPAGDQNSAFYVTNGLLTIELIGGRCRWATARARARYPADIPLAGDTDDATAPTYAAFAREQHEPGNGDHQTGPARRPPHDRQGGQVGDEPQGRPARRDLVYYDHHPAQHPERLLGLPQRRGRSTTTAQTSTAPLNDPWFYASGLPITDAYWAKVKIGGQQDVLIQAFERRVLTYTPANPPAFQVRWATSASTTTTGAIAMPVNPPAP